MGLLTTQDKVLRCIRCSQRISYTHRTYKTSQEMWDLLPRKEGISIDSRETNWAMATQCRGSHRLEATTTQSKADLKRNSNIKINKGSILRNLWAQSATDLWPLATLSQSRSSLKGLWSFLKQLIHPNILSLLYLSKENRNAKVVKWSKTMLLIKRTSYRCQRTCRLHRQECPLSSKAVGKVWPSPVKTQQLATHQAASL